MAKEKDLKKWLPLISAAVFAVSAIVNLVVLISLLSRWSAFLSTVSGLPSYVEYDLIISIFQVVASVGFAVLIFMKKYNALLTIPAVLYMAGQIANGYDCMAEAGLVLFGIFGLLEVIYVITISTIKKRK